MGIDAQALRSVRRCSLRLVNMRNGSSEGSLLVSRIEGRWSLQTAQRPHSPGTSPCVRGEFTQPEAIHFWGVTEECVPFASRPLGFARVADRPQRATPAGPGHVGIFARSREAKMRRAPLRTNDLVLLRPRPLENGSLRGTGRRSPRGSLDDETNARPLFP
jgi:hypothetical protein